MNGAGLQGPARAEFAYSDYAQLQSQYANAENTPENLQKAARHFESIFIDMWLKSAREANKVMAEGNFLGGAYMDTSQQMLDHEMAVHLADQGGIGLAEVIMRQLSGDIGATPNPQTRAEFTPSSTQGPMSRKNEFDTPKSFVDTLLPVVQQALKGVGLSATAVISQAALETGWGAHVIARPDGQSSHNLFGIKAREGDQQTVQVKTKEFEHGRWLNKAQLFKAYDSWTDSVQDYVEKITSERRYTPALQVAHDPAEYGRALQHSGYATDPNYAEKIADIANRVGQMLSGGI